MRFVDHCIGSLFLLIALVASAAEAPPLLRVDGNRLITSDERPVRLHGVNIASLEWSSKGEHVMQSVTEVTANWNCNVIRLPLSQDRWFGKTKDQKDNGAAYQKIVRDVVELASSKRSYVLLDLHWSNAGQWGANIGQHYMPDTNSVTFWESVATEFANNPAVLFDLYNEPHDVSWNVWRDGGEITEKKKTNSLTYHSPGMQKLLDTCRAKGARNVVVAGGLDWAYDLSGIVQGSALKDPQGNGVVYATHIYPWKKNWDKHVTVATTNFCVLVGEAGCEPKAKDEDPVTWAPKILAYIEQHQLNWTAWDLHPGAGPSLIKDWNYTPTTYWGVPAKKALLESKP